MKLLSRIQDYLRNMYNDDLYCYDETHDMAISVLGYNLVLPLGLDLSRVNKGIIDKSKYHSSIKDYDPCNKAVEPEKQYLPMEGWRAIHDHSLSPQSTTRVNFRLNNNP